MTFSVSYWRKCLFEYFRLEKETSYEEIVEKVKAASNGPMKGVVQVSNEPLVSTDFNTTTFSSTLDAKAGIELNSTFYKCNFLL